MSDNLKAKIQNNMKDAMRAKEADRLSTIRLLMAAIKQREIDEQITLDDTGIIQVLEKMIKQRRESIKQYTAANRQDLADKEQLEIDHLQVYMPQALSEVEINQLIESAMSETGATSIKDMGRLMAALKPKLQGRADMGQVSQIIKSKLNP